MNGQPIAIFPEGKHTATSGEVVEVTPAILEELASTYNPKLHEAPAVCGHPKEGAPAYGWADKLEVKDGMLYATLKEVNTDFAEGVKAGAWKKRSASIYLPNTPGNPTPGKHYLRHIGFLGAQPPAIKGMPDINFNENDGAITLEFSEPNTTPEQGVDAGGGATPPPVEPSIKQSPPVAGGESAIPPSTNKVTNTMPEPTPPKENDKEKILADREAAIAIKEAELASKEQAAKETAIASFTEGLVKTGQLLPAQVASVKELLINMPTDKPLEFAEGNQTISKPADEVLKDLLKSLPKQVDFAEKSKDDGANPDKLTAAALAKKAEVYQAEQAKLGIKISTADAVLHITKGAK